MPRRHSATSRKNVRAREHEAEAIRLRLSGLSYSQIADEIGGITPQAAHKMVKRVLEREAKKTAENAEKVIALELKRMDTILIGIWDAARKGDLKAIDRVLRIMERRAKLLGIDASPSSAAPSPDEGSVFTITFDGKPCT